MEKNCRACEFVKLSKEWMDILGCNLKCEFYRLEGCNCPYFMPKKVHEWMGQ